MRQERWFDFVIDIIVLTIFLLLLTLLAKVVSADTIEYTGRGNVEPQTGPWCVGVSLEYAYERMYDEQSPISGKGMWYSITKTRLGCEDRGTTLIENMRVMRPHLGAFLMVPVNAEDVVRYMTWDTQLIIGFQGHMAPVIGFDMDEYEFIYLDTRGRELSTSRISMYDESIRECWIITRKRSQWSLDLSCTEVHWTEWLK